MNRKNVKNTMKVALCALVFLGNSSYAREVEDAQKLIDTVLFDSVNELSDLLKSGLDANARNEFGTTALMVASSLGKVDKVTVLLDHGAELNYKDNDRGTALIYAVFYGQEGVVELLYERGAKIPTNEEVDRFVLASEQKKEQMKERFKKMKEAGEWVYV